MYSLNLIIFHMRKRRVLRLTTGADVLAYFNYPVWVAYRRSMRIGIGRQGRFRVQCMCVGGSGSFESVR